MKRIKIYEYDKRNREHVVHAMDTCAGQIISWSMFAQESERVVFPVGTQHVFIDVSSLFSNEERAGLSIAQIEKIIAIILRSDKYKMHLIVERQYSQTLRNLVYYRISDINSLEELLHLKDCVSTNIVDVSQKKFTDICNYINHNLFGNNAFKSQLFSELEKFRVFNATGYQSIFSILLCGNTGIGKTELARLLHHGLSGSEPIIKINFGNYSSENSLNSLIGSPRGYIGSTKGELSEKLSTSRSSVILIDEFEKASKQVYNFFLQLLEDGRFTDSQGRDYDLNKYIIVFTSNLQATQITERLSAELRSRFNMICLMANLTTQEKKAYVSYKVDKILEMLRTEKNISISQEYASLVKEMDVQPHADMRQLNSEIMRRMAEVVYPVIYNE